MFFSGISFKLACSLLAHLFSINVSWTSTSKEVTKSNFFLQVPMILKQFWGQIILSIVVIVSPSVIDMRVSYWLLGGSNHRYYFGRPPFVQGFQHRGLDPRPDYLYRSPHLAFCPRPILHYIQRKYSSDETRVSCKLIISSKRARCKIFASRLVSCFGFWVLGHFVFFRVLRRYAISVFHTERSFSTELLECATRVLPIIEALIPIVCLLFRSSVFGSRGG